MKGICVKLKNRRVTIAELQRDKIIIEFKRLIKEDSDMKTSVLHRIYK